MEMIRYDVGVAGAVTPAEPLPDLPPMPKGCLVIVGGRAPIWRYGQALHKLHGSAAGAVATYDPRLGAVVVMSHSTEVREGAVIAYDW